MRIKTLSANLIALALLMALPLTASAQVGADQIVPGISDARLSQWTGERLAALGSGEPIPVRQARMDLLQPLRAADDDSAFRLQYSRALEQGGLARIANDGDSLVAINAVIIAGELATQLSVGVLDRALEDRREAVRYEAARSMGLLLSAYDRGSAAIPANQIDGIFGTISSRFQAETSDQVIDAMILALANPGSDPDFRSRCMRAMCDGVSAIARRWRTEPPTETRALIIFRAIDAAYDDLLGVQGAVDRDFAVKAAIGSGQALTMLVHWIENIPPGSLKPEGRQLAVDLAGAAERVILLAHNTLTGELLPEKITRAAKDFIEGRPGATLQDVTDAIDEWIGRTGRLHSAPYNAPANAFD